MDPTRLQWNRDGDEALRRCGENLKLYRQKFQEVRAEHEGKKQRAVARYGLSDHPSHGAWQIYEDNNNNIVEVEIGDSRSLTKLSNLILGLPRRDDNQVDTALALAVINQNFADLARLACGDFLNAETLRRMRDMNASSGNLASDNPRGSMFQQVLTQVEREFSEVAGCYRGGQVSESVLKAICWPLFKTPAQYQRSTEIHRYSSDSHISYDNSGREFRRYVV